MLRRLDPKADELLYMQAYSWLAESPRWRKDSEAVWEPEDYLAATHDPARMDVGVFDGGEMVATITLNLRAVGLYEVHLEAAPRTKVGLVVEAGREAADWMFNCYGAQQIWCWVVRANRPMRKIIKSIGFASSGVTMWRGVSHGKLIEWQQFTIGA